MIRIGRRGLLAAFGATLAAVGLRPGGASAASHPARRNPIDIRWLVDASLDDRDVVALCATTPIRLHADLVRQWRDGLAEVLLSERGVATALVRWDKAFVLQGLAREAGMQARVERLAPSLFQVTLAGGKS